jgi:hypothetical protein
VSSSLSRFSFNPSVGQKIANPALFESKNAHPSGIFHLDLEFQYNCFSLPSSVNTGWKFRAYMSRPFRQSPAPVLFFAVLLLISCLMTAGCAVRFISDYDDVLDKDVTDLQQGTETFLNQLDSEVGTPAAAYRANSDFYVKTNATLRTMLTRAASQPKSKIIVGEVEALEKTFDDLQNLHKMNGDKGLSSANIANTRSALESEFASILTLELALKSHNGAPSTALPSPKTK